MIDSKNYKFVEYNAHYSRSCAELVKESWNLHEGYVNIQNIDSVYELYVRDCVDFSEYTDLIIDNNDKVVGILFGSHEQRILNAKLTVLSKRLRTKVWQLIRLMKGEFGEILPAIKTYTELNKDDAAGEAYSDQFASEVNLFIVSKSLRGGGFGYELMNRYIHYCRIKGLNSVFLWTDLDCSYTFYDRYGFQLFQRFTKRQDSMNINDKGNGLIYWYQVNK